ncbi:hypothetical protein C5167_023668 [Papaver somniferum]|uniref:Uncharacterized protein n=1 Tax=Papaver somniferum TaxID=3469 RepID=A0A4Y7JMX6_PAPSO|nr:hypothetical protein C5167_023668 [Papaver somniferum]
MMVTRAAKLARSALAARKTLNSSSASYYNSLCRRSSSQILNSSIIENPNTRDIISSSPIKGANNGVISSSINSFSYLQQQQRRHFHSSNPSYSPSASSGEVTPSDFTEMAWEGVVGAVEAARLSKQQIVSPNI